MDTIDKSTDTASDSSIKGSHENIVTLSTTGILPKNLNWGVVLAALSILLTLYFNYIQDRKWDTLNQAKLDISDVYLGRFDEMDFDTVNKQTWIGQVRIHSLMSDKVLSHNYGIFEELIFLDTKDNHQILVPKIMISKVDLDNQIASLGLEEKIRTHAVEAVKHSIIVCRYKNVGQLSATNVKIQIELKIHNQIVAVPDLKVLEISPGHEMAGPIDLTEPLNRVIEDMTLRLYMSYVSNGVTYTRVMGFLYDSKRNMFMVHDLS